MDLCGQFLEEYKRLDSLCRDCLDAREGVSEYIRQMENTPPEESRLVPDWEEDYRILKELRQIRNRLVHGVGTWGSGCTENDLEWVRYYHRCILTQADPLAVAWRAKQAEEERLASERRARQAEAERLAREQAAKAEKKDSPLRRLFERIKRFFGGRA